MARENRRRGGMFGEKWGGGILKERTRRALYGMYSNGGGGENNTITRGGNWGHGGESDVETLWRRAGVRKNEDVFYTGEGESRKEKIGKFLKVSGK